MSNLNRKQDDEVEEQVFEACIFNCSYAEQQLEDEEKGSSINANKKKSKTDQKVEVVVVDSISEEGTMSMDDKSLLDYDSSQSWENEKESSSQ